MRMDTKPQLQENSLFPETVPTLVPHQSAQEHFLKLLEGVRKEEFPKDNSLETQMDELLNQLSHKDFPQLHQARATLTIKSKDKKIDVFFQSHVMTMVRTLSLYLDHKLSCTWREASMLAAKVSGCGSNHT
jgi:hypothetical protein